MRTQTPEVQFCSRSEAARLLGLSTSTVARLVAEGRLKGGRVGLAKWGISRASLAAYTEAVLSPLPGKIGGEP